MDIIKEFISLDFKSIFIAFFTIVGCFIFVVEAIKKLFNIFGIESKWLKQTSQDHESIKKSVERIDNIERYQELNYKAIKEISKTVESVSSQLDEIQEQSTCTASALIETMADRLNQKCQVYINTKHGIPEDEVEEFVSYYNKYEQIGGNHGLKRKVDYCLEKLPIIPSIYPKE